MANALIIYTSLTGNTEACVDIVADQLEENDIDVTIYDVMEADPEDFLDYDICLVGCYAYGDHGVLPDEMEDFYLELENIDLVGKIYGSFGSGDDFYPLFCGQVDDFEVKFDLTGAVKGAQGVKVNLYPEEEDEQNLRNFADAIAQKSDELI